MEVEPIETDSPFLEPPNVVLTPHPAAQAIKPTAVTIVFAAGDMTRGARGEEPESAVAPV